MYTLCKVAVRHPSRPESFIDNTIFDSGKLSPWSMTWLCELHFLPSRFLKLLDDVWCCAFRYWMLMDLVSCLRTADCGSHRSASILFIFSSQSGAQTHSEETIHHFSRSTKLQHDDLFWTSFFLCVGDPTHETFKLSTHDFHLETSFLFFFLMSQKTPSVSGVSNPFNQINLAGRSYGASAARSSDETYYLSMFS